MQRLTSLLFGKKKPAPPLDVVSLVTAPDEKGICDLSPVAVSPSSPLRLTQRECVQLALAAVPKEQLVIAESGLEMILLMAQAAVEPAPVKATGVSILDQLPDRLLGEALVFLEQLGVKACRRVAFPRPSPSGDHKRRPCMEVGPEFAVPSDMEVLCLMPVM